MSEDYRSDAYLMVLDLYPRADLTRNTQVSNLFVGQLERGGTQHHSPSGPSLGSFFEKGGPASSQHDTTTELAANIVSGIVQKCLQALLT